jgi:hypothetical protein
LTQVFVMAIQPHGVMPGLDPGIHRAAAPLIAGSSPAMTPRGMIRFLRWLNV